jgi:HEAT repeat protein
MHIVRNPLALIVSLGFLLAATSLLPAQSADELLPKVAAWKLGDDRKPMEALEQLVAKSAADPAQRSALAKKLVAILDKPDATTDGKEFVCRQLYVIATPAEVPAVARLLGDEKLSHMARYVLEAMADPPADAALREAMKTTKGKLLIGIVNSLGVRRDAQSVPAFTQMLAGPDPALAIAAASALGKIANDEATKALASAKSTPNADLHAVVIDAYLKCADERLKNGKPADAAAIYRELYAQDQPMRIRAAALRGLVAAEPQTTVPLLLELIKGQNAQMQAIACRYAQTLPGGETTSKALAASLNGLKPDAAELLIDALAIRGDPAARAAVLSAIKSPDDTIQTAALKAMGQLGTAGDVAMLAEVATKGGRTGDAARDALARMPGTDVDAAIAANLQKGTPEVRQELMKALAARGTSSAVPALLDVAVRDGNEPVRIAALNALGALAGGKDFPAIVDQITAAKSNAERDAARNAAAAVCSRMDNRDEAAAPIIAAIAKATGPAKVALIQTLPRIRSATALAAAQAAMKDADKAVSDAGTRAVIDWTDDSAVPAILAIAQGDNQTYRVLALRGLVRLTNAPTAKTSARAKLDLYKQLLTLCQRPEEKRIVLAGISDVKTAESLAIVTPFLADPALKNEAASAVVKLAKSIGAARAKAALQQIVTSDANAAVKKQAQDLLNK